MELVHMAFQDGVLAEEATWRAVVLIPKGGGLLPRHRSRVGGVEGCGSDS